MIPKDASATANTTGVGGLVSPSDGTIEFGSNKSHAGGWMRPKETYIEEDEKQLQKRVSQDFEKECSEFDLYIDR